MIIISHVIYVAKDMSEKCEHGRIQGKLICLDCRKVFIELEAFQAGEKKGRELAEIEIFDIKPSQIEALTGVKRILNKFVLQSMKDEWYQKGREESSKENTKMMQRYADLQEELRLARSQVFDEAIKIHKEYCDAGKMRRNCKELRKLKEKRG